MLNPGNFTIHFGSITSRCMGNEPAFLRRRERTICGTVQTERDAEIKAIIHFVFLGLLMVTEVEFT